MQLVQQCFLESFHFLLSHFFCTTLNRCTVLTKGTSCKVHLLLLPGSSRQAAFSAEMPANAIQSPAWSRIPVSDQSIVKYSSLGDDAIHVECGTTVAMSLLMAKSTVQVPVRSFETTKAFVSDCLAYIGPQLPPNAFDLNEPMSQYGSPLRPIVRQMQCCPFDRSVALRTRQIHDLG